jgi:hypothetical protein
MERAFASAEQQLNENRSTSSAELYGRFRSAAWTAGIGRDIARLEYEKHKLIHSGEPEIRTAVAECAVAFDS